MKKKFFVLRSTSSSGPARLEYYDSDKKFNAGHLPKRSIHLHACFNINKKSDSRHKNAIALYTKEECFSVVCDDEKDQENWLALMLEYQNEYIRDGEQYKEHYEYVWQILVQPKGLGHMKNIRGQYRLCMTRQNICLVKLNAERPQFIFQLETVRSLAHNENLFRMEVGKIAPTGEGELWMQCDDAVIAQNIHETILTFMKNMDLRRDMNTTVTMPRQSEFRHRTSSESFTQGSSRMRKVDQTRPMSSYTGTARSTSHLQCPVSPGTSPCTHGFDQPIMGAHRLRSDSNDSKASRSSMPPLDDFLDLHSLSLGPDIMPLEEEPDYDDHLSIPSSPGSQLADHDDYDGQSQGYMDMQPGSVTPPTPGNTGGYMDMAPGMHKEDQGSAYLPMNPLWQSSAPIPIHPHQDMVTGYMDMSTHNPLPPVKEGGSTEGYVPMSPSYSASPSGSSSSHLRPDRVACMLSDDGSDFTQPPMRTYSLGSRPVKAGLKYSGYVDMSASKAVSDNGRSCSAPHLITHLPHHHRNSRNSTMESPTPSASPLSMSLKSDDSDSFMELDFYRPRTASDSHGYRPRAASFGMPHTSQAQGHRPRSSSHGQGTRPLRKHRMAAMIDPAGRLNHDLFHRSQNSSTHGSFDSLRVSSSESLRKLSQEVRTKTSQLNNSDYMDMSFEKRHTPSPQPGSSVGSRSGQNGYVDMTLGHRKSSPNRSNPKMTSRSSSKASSSEKLHESEYTCMTLGGGAPDSVYVNYDSHEGAGKKDSPSRSSSSENVDTYIMYEPATTPTSSSGKAATPKAETPSVDPRARSGSQGKELKKRSFFHLHTSKHSSKKSEPSQQPPAATSYSSTGGEKFGSLGRNIRQKSKDSEKITARKSGSFSRTFGTTAQKPGKLLRKTPTPPKSLDGNDEYIEFSPMAVKSDSDSSHSSGSTHGSRTRREAASARQEAEYVGFQPGNIPATSPGSGPRSSGGSSAYMSMSAAGSGGQGSVGGQGSMFKPVSKSAPKRSRSREESSQSSPVAPPPTTHPPSSDDPQLPKPLPVYPSQTVPEVQGRAVSAVQGHTPPPLPGQTSTTVQGQSSQALQGQTLQTVQSHTLQTVQGQAVEGQCLPAAASASPAAGVSEIVLVMAGGDGSDDTPTPSASSSLPPSPSSSSSSSTVLSKPSPTLLSSDSGYMDFDPSRPASSATSSNSSIASVVSVVARPAQGKSLLPDDKLSLSASPSPKGSPAAVSPKSPSSPSSPYVLCTGKASPLDKMSGKQGGGEPLPVTSPLTGASLANPLAVGSPANPLGVVSAVTVSPVSPGGRSGKGSAGAGIAPTRKISAEKLVAGGGAASRTSQASSPADGKNTSGGSSDRTAKPKEIRSSRLSQGSQGSQGSQELASSGGTQQGLTRPDSTPCMLNMDKPAVTGRGRGRHCSSSSAVGSQAKKGKNSNGNGNNSSKDSGATKSDAGLLQINPEADARHSITDLSGYAQMSFPSNALSRQQPTHIRQHPPSTTTSSSGGSGPVGGSQGVLNYAQLDLGSTDSMGEAGDSARSPRSKSRHPSAPEEKSEPLSYATIDFEKSENLRNAATVAAKEVKRTL